MKTCFLALVCLLTFTITSLAQSTETFDLATFQSPTGWNKQSKGGVLIFNTSNQQKGTYAMIMLYASGQSSGNAKSDFENDWQQFIAGQLEVKNKPQLEPAKTVEGWQSITGGAAFENNIGTSAVILNTFSGYGKSFSVASVFNSEDYLPAIEAFSLSVELRKPEAKLNTTDDSASIMGTWGVSSGNHSSYAMSNGLSGYIKRQYTFNADGTYIFLSKNFQMTSDKILLVRQHGKYQVSGNNLTISPTSSVIEAWSKKQGIDEWGTRVNSQPYPLEKVTYQFTKHYFSGIQTWSLVFQSGTATQRDGPYVGGSAFDNAWIYQPPCEKCLIELPR